MLLPPTFRKETRKWTSPSSSTPIATPSPSGWWSPIRPATGPPSTDRPSRSCCAPRWARRPTPSAPPRSPSTPTAAPPSWARWARARPSSRPPPPTWPASAGCSSSARPTSRASGSARWRTPSPTPAPSSSPPSPTWSACASRMARDHSSWSCRGSGPSSRFAGCPPSSSAGRRWTAGSSATRRRWSPSASPAARTASSRSSTRTGCP